MDIVGTHLHSQDMTLLLQKCTKSGHTYKKEGCTGLLEPHQYDLCTETFKTAENVASFTVASWEKLWKTVWQPVCFPRHSARTKCSCCHADRTVISPSHDARTFPSHSAIIVQWPCLKNVPSVSYECRCCCLPVGCGSHLELWKSTKSKWNCQRASDGDGGQRGGHK